MKRVLSAVLAVALLGTTAASAHDRDGGYRHEHNNDGAAIGLGLGLLVLGIIAASGSRNHHGSYYGSDDGESTYDNGGYAHARFHRQLDAEHARAHDEGFEDGADHADTHDALDSAHTQWHLDHPDVVDDGTDDSTDGDN